MEVSELPGGRGKVVTTTESTSMMVFQPPDEVRTWLDATDWEAMEKVWQKAESQALELPQSELDHFSSCYSTSEDSGSLLVKSESRRPRHRRPEWNEAFHLVGNDSRYPPPKRRYFDALPAETGLPKEAVRPGLRPKDPLLAELDAYFAPKNSTGVPWNRAYSQTASSDNTGLHPYLRHYFDQRGLEATYRQRPHVDGDYMRKLQRRAHGRPSTREKMLRWSKSDSALASASQMLSTSSAPGSETETDVKARGEGNIPWSTRCLMYGPSAAVREGEAGEKIPWVYDHHRSEAEDNVVLNPLLRHYFDKDGLFSSFRNRGRHYGRPLPPVFGRQFPMRAPGQSEHNASLAPTSSSLR